MAKSDRDLFDRLRDAGLRKQVAKKLSGIGENAGKKAVTAARNAATELRSLADDIESRLPALPGAGSRSGAAQTTRSGPTSRASAAKPAARKTTARKPTARKPAARKTAARRSTTSRSTATKPTATKPTATKPTAARNSSGGSRAPRGANKAKILASLSSGPKTASEIASETGIGVGTVGSTLTKMAGSGEVQKAARGYALPS
jgi:hypothetical protein